MTDRSRRRIRFALFGAALVVVVATALVAAELTSRDGGALEVKDAWVRATVPLAGGEADGMGAGTGEAGRVTGAFLVLENTSGQAERLVGASVSADVAAAVEIHETMVDAGGVMRMRPVQAIDVPADGRAELKPGGYHIMLLDVQHDLNPGEMVALTLTFASGKTLTVNADVRPLE